MNDFASTVNASGILQNDYLGAALKRKREKLKDTKLGVSEDEMSKRMDEEKEE